MDATGNHVVAPIWEVSNNTTTAQASVVANRATLTYKATIGANSIAEKVGRIEGGCALYETYLSTRSWQN